MPHRSDLPRRRTPHPRAGVLVLLLLILGVALPTPGQVPEQSQKHYFNDRTFEVPFELDRGMAVKHVLLHVSTDNGKTFKHVSTTGPRARAFVFTATNEGWHQFVVQIETYQEKRIPAQVDSSMVGLMVCVDTQKPDVKLESIQPKDGATAAVVWKVTDNVDVDQRRLSLDYRRGSSGIWTALNFRQMKYARYDWSPPEAGEYEVRLTAYDMAGNSAEKTVKLKVGNPTVKGGQGEIPVGDTRVLYVPKRTFKLDYKIEGQGPSSVQRVEVWMTRNKSQWTRLEPDAPADPKDGHEVTVKGAGRWGFTLRPISGVGRAHKAPGLGDPPQIWVEVDETAPVVTLDSVTVGEGADNKSITVNWSATDRFLGEKPITIYYSETKAEGTWQPLVSGVENTGSYKVSTEKITSYQFYVKVEAVDRAGNRGSAHTQDTVKADTSEPRVKDLTIIGVKP